MSFLRTLFIFLCIVFCVGYIFRLITPWLLRKAVNNVEKKMNQATQKKSQEKKKEGDIVVGDVPENREQILDNIGEYTEFTEIEEETDNDDSK